MNTAAVSLAPALCFDCTTPLPADARYDVCTSCLRAQVSAERERESCANSMPERGECVCSQHGSVR